MNLLFMANNGLPRNGLVALYDMGKQIALGNTGQTLVDFSGRGNSAQLGSTAGADTNDPAYSGQGLTFGIDDYAKSSSSAFDDMQAFTCITVCKPLSAGGGSEGRIFSKTYRDLYYYDGKIRFLQFAATVSGDWRSAVLPTMGSAFAFSLSYQNGIKPSMYLNQNKIGVTEIANTSGTLNSDSAKDLYIGNRATADRNFDGTFYLQAWYNRVLSDSEYMQAYNYLRRLMMSRGVVI